MKKATKILCGVLAAVLLIGLAAACNLETNSDKITVISREEASGTRGAFIELFGVEVKNDDGSKNDRTFIRAEIADNTNAVMTGVSTNPGAIGYISLGSLNNTVKAVSIDGVMPSIDTIKDGTYKIQRPFNIVTKDNLSDVAQDFVNFILSKEGQAIVEERGFIPMDNASAFAGDKPAGKIHIDGSSSVSPLMERLITGYKSFNPNAEVELQETDSGKGIKSAIDGNCDIGMASRDVRDEELAQGLKNITIATDGIVVIVNNDSEIANATVEQIMKIYIGEVTLWSELSE